MTVQPTKLKRIMVKVLLWIHFKLSGVMKDEPLAPLTSIKKVIAEIASPPKSAPNLL